jgi:hypothetical protein
MKYPMMPGSDDISALLYEQLELDENSLVLVRVYLLALRGLFSIYF